MKKLALLFLSFPCAWALACSDDEPNSDAGIDAGASVDAGDPSLAAIRGLEIYASLGCASCHCNAAEGGCNLNAPSIRGVSFDALNANLRFASTAEEDPDRPDPFDPHPFKAKTISDAELRDLAWFLRVVGGDRPVQNVDSLISRGFDLYISGTCISCHLMSGLGSNQGGIGAPIAGIDPDTIYTALTGGVQCHPLQSSVTATTACGVLGQFITDNETVLALTDTPPPDQDDERSLLAYFLAFVSPPPTSGSVAPCDGVSGQVCTVAGNGVGGYIGDSRTATATLVYYPQGIDLVDWDDDGSLDLIIDDWNNHRIRAVHLGIERGGIENPIETIAGNGKVTGLDALNHPVDIAFDQNRNLLIATFHNQNIYRYINGAPPGTRRDQPLGQCDIRCGPDDTTALGAPIGLPIGIDVLPDQRIVFSEALCGRIRILDITGTATITQPAQCIDPVRLFGDSTLTTLAGKQAMFGYEGDDGPARDAVFFSNSSPNFMSFGISIEKGTNAGRRLYVADSGNNVIRYVDLSQNPPTVHLLAGTPGQIGLVDGPARQAKFNYPVAVYAAPDGAVYVADQRNHAIRRIGADGIVVTLAGTGRAGFNGDNRPGDMTQLDAPGGVVLHPDGRVFFTDTNNNRVRYIVP